MDNTLESSGDGEKNKSCSDEAQANSGKPRMSFAEWKKSNSSVSEPPKQRSHTKTHPIQQGNRGVQFNREPPPLMSLSVNQNNFGLPPSNNFNNNFNNGSNNNNNFSNNYNNCNNNFNSNNNFNNNYNNNFNNSNPNICKPLQPPPFWEDMFSPLRQPPMQRPLSRWQPENRETVGYQHRSRSNKPHARAKQGNQTNESKPSEEAIAAAILMPPPPPPPEKTNSNNSQKAQAKKHNFTQQVGWMQKPQPPPPIDEKDPGSKEERQRLWKEYRMAMKPFKNREFHNAKRCVQRLSKLPPSELDEKQTERLQKAMEYVAAHKAMLTVKHAERWVQKENPESDSNGSAQVFVRKPISSFWDNGNGQNTMQKHVPSGKQYGAGRAIKGGPGGAVVGSVYALPKPANNANFGYSHVSPGYVGDANVSYNNSGSESQNYYSGYGSNFVRGDTLMPST